MTWLELNRKVDWTLLSKVQTPSPYVLAGISILATVRHYVQVDDKPFQIPFRPWFFIVGFLLVAACWGLIHLLRPKTIALTSAKRVKASVDVLDLIASFEADAEAFKGTYRSRDLVSTVEEILGSKTPSWGGAEPTRGQLFAELRRHYATLDAGKIQFAAKEFFNHLRKGMQLTLLVPLVAGYVFEGISGAIMLYQLLG